MLKHVEAGRSGTWNFVQMLESDVQMVKGNYKFCKRTMVWPVQHNASPAILNKKFHIVFTCFYNHRSMDPEQLSPALRAKRHASQGSQHLWSCCSSWESFAHLPGQTGGIEPTWIIWSCSNLPCTSWQHCQNTLNNHWINWIPFFQWIYSTYFIVAFFVEKSRTQHAPSSPLEASPGTLWPVKSCLGDRQVQDIVFVGMLKGLNGPKMLKMD